MLEEPFSSKKISQFKRRFTSISPKQRSEIEAENINKREAQPKSTRLGKKLFSMKVNFEVSGKSDIVFFMN